MREEKLSGVGGAEAPQEEPQPLWICHSGAPLLCRNGVARVVRGKKPDVTYKERVAKF